MTWRKCKNRPIIIVMSLFEMGENWHKIETQGSFQNDDRFADVLNLTLLPLYDFWLPK